MPRRHPSIPPVWLMTDERMGDRLWHALERLPRGSGVIFRHYSLAAEARAALFAKVLRVARRRRLVLLRAGATPMRGEMGVHGSPIATRHGLRTAPAHSRAEAAAAVRRGVDALLVSPLFATRSHPGARVLGPLRAALMTRGLRVSLIALGGMDVCRFQAIRRLGFEGWAAIDAWTRD